MRVVVNGEVRTVGAELTLRELVVQVGARPDAVAVAQNGEVVPRGRLGDQRVHDGDRVEIIRAVGGG